MLSACWLIGAFSLQLAVTDLPTSTHWAWQSMHSMHSTHPLTHAEFTTPTEL